MMATIGASGRPLSELANALRRRYFGLDEVSIPAADPELALERAEEAFPGGKATRLDGLTMDFSDWRFTLRPSQTEPVLRLTVEAYREGLAEPRRDELARIASGA